jgi:DNA (cytosine-5)-methyltransferase 1
MRRAFDNETLPLGFRRELVVDNFAGGGGASEGIEQALCRPIDIAINHDPIAIAVHKANHPGTTHYCESVFKVDPEAITGNQPVGLGWFSPDCTHHSKARGGKPREQKIRGLAWVVIRWAKRVKPRVILLENVEEFQDWGPLTPEGMPVTSKKGTTFRLWANQLIRYGYKVEWRELRASDYGTPTIRKRLFVIARRDNRPIVWPDATHAEIKPLPADPSKLKCKACASVFASLVDHRCPECGLLPWVPAANCIDWHLDCPSIFERKRPLAEATLRRIARGLRKYVLEAAQPFVIPLTHQGSDRVESLDEPMRTVTGAHRGERALVQPYVVQMAHGEGTPNGVQRWGKGIRDINDPLNTVTASGSGGIGIVTPFLTEHANSSCERNFSVEDPLRTQMASVKGGHFAMIAPTLMKNMTNNVGQHVDDPLSTTLTGNHHYLMSHTLVATGYGERPGQSPRAMDIEDPLGTVVGAGKHALVSTFLAKHYGGHESPGSAMSDPMSTVTTQDHNGLVAATLIGAGGSEYAAKPRSIEDPMGTQTTENHRAIVTAHITKFRSGSTGTAMDEPMHTITAGGKQARPGTAGAMGMVTAHLEANYSQKGNESRGSAPADPMRTVTGTPRHSIVTSHLMTLHNNQTGSDLREPMGTILAGGTHIAEVRAFLQKYPGEIKKKPSTRSEAAKIFDELGIVHIDNIPYQITDIGCRMVQAKELLLAQGFPQDYVLDIKASLTKRFQETGEFVIDPDADDPSDTKTISKASQIRLVGNSVCPPLAKALVAANFTHELVMYGEQQKAA